MYRFLFLFISSIVCAPGWAAGGVDHALIDFVRIDASGKGIVHFFTALTGTPAACNPSFDKDLGFDTNTDAGRAVFSMLIAAKVSGARITARGTGACAVYAAVEDWSYGSLE